MDATAARQQITGPEPPPGRVWCVPCAFDYLDHAARGAVPVPPLHAAVTRSVYPPLMQLGPLDLCWGHLVKVEFRQAVADPAGQAAVPLLVPGRG